MQAQALCQTHLGARHVRPVIAQLHSLAVALWPSHPLMTPFGPPVVTGSQDSQGISPTAETEEMTPVKTRSKSEARVVRCMLKRERLEVGWEFRGLRLVVLVTVGKSVFSRKGEIKVDVGRVVRRTALGDYYHVLQVTVRLSGTLGSARK